MFFAEVGLGEILWSMLVFFFMVIYFMALFSVLVDLFRDHELNGLLKAVWVLFLLFLPLLSLVVYLIARGDGMAKRSVAEAASAQADFEGYVKNVATAAPADQIAKAKDLLDSGAISEDEYASLKAKALG